MPLKRCTINNKSGYKWGDSGKCYTGPGAKEKALKQGRAIEVNKSKGSIFEEFLEELTKNEKKKKKLESEL